jgi:polysaccharide pyruvyl transferase WcaK-like protein
VNRIFTSRRPIHRVGLISPYTGGNLGNAAIISAMIANIRTRIPDAEIVGITLNPDDTRRRHGIQAFPLTPVPYSNYSPDNDFETRHRTGLLLSKVKRRLARIPWLRCIVRDLRGCAGELAHTASAAALVRKLDRVVITGGGALDEFWGGPWGHPWNLFKWGILSRIFRVPFLFVSVGKCQLEQRLSRFFVGVALWLGEYRSYRDVESKMGVQTLIDAQNDPVYPDLAFSYPCPIIQTTNSLHDDQRWVGVSPMAYCDPRAWPLKDERRYAAYLSQLAELVKWLLKNRHSILFFTTDGCDAATVDDLKAMIAGSATGGAEIQTLPASTEQSVDNFLKAISRVDLTIASRLHGVILSHLNATPVLAISFDPKVDAHMSAMDQKEYCLSIDNLKAETLIARFNALKSASQREKDHLSSAARRFRGELDLQYDRILGASHSSPAKREDEKQIGDFLHSDVSTIEDR